MQKSENINELATALATAQGNIKAAKEDSENPFFKSNYADLSSVWDACRKPLTDNGLSIIQTTNNSEDKVIIETTLLHKSGQWITSTLSLKPKADDPQSIGSTITYGRRYSLSAMVGVCSEEDDDGNAASKPEPKKPEVNTAEHYCQTHKVNFFKKGAMKGYAHQVVGGGWCNEAVADIPVAPEKPVAQPHNAKSEGSVKEVGVDMEWLRESLKKLKWEEGTAMSWIEATFKVKRAGTLEDTIMLLTKDQKGKLCDFVVKASTGSK